MKEREGRRQRASEKERNRQTVHIVRCAIIARADNRSAVCVIRVVDDRVRVGTSCSEVMFTGAAN